jgi:hypothetical protein
LPDELIVFLVVENLTPERVLLLSNKSLKTFIVSLTITSLEVTSRRQKKSNHLQTLCVLSDVKFSQSKDAKRCSVASSGSKGNGWTARLVFPADYLDIVCVPPSQPSGG